jgi:hypothetical protein
MSMDPTVIALIGGLGGQVLTVVALAVRTRRKRQVIHLRLRIRRDGDE